MRSPVPWLWFLGAAALVSCDQATKDRDADPTVDTADASETVDTGVDSTDSVDTAIDDSVHSGDTGAETGDVDSDDSSGAVYQWTDVSIFGAGACALGSWGYIECWGARFGGME